MIVPFVTTRSDVACLNELGFKPKLHRRTPYSKAGAVTGDVWLDLGMDGFPIGKEERWATWWNAVANADKFRDLMFVGRPEKGAVSQAIGAALTKAGALSAKRVSVPQLPHAADARHNKLNKLLAAAFTEWRSASGYAGEATLPVIIASKQSLESKTERDKKTKTVSELAEVAGAGSLWVVDATLEDQAGTTTFEKRFGHLIEFHSALTQFENCQRIVAGPYWGVGLVLFARGLATEVAVGVGSAYRYYRPGTIITSGATSRIAVTPIRRWAKLSPQLVDWLDKARSLFPPSSSTAVEFSALAAFVASADEQAARRQVAKFHLEWATWLEKTPAAQRPMALFQDLSGAYAAAKFLPPIPSEEGVAAVPHTTAKQLMLHCL